MNFRFKSIRSQTPCAAVLGLLSALGFASPARAQTPVYTVIDLGTLDGAAYSAAYGINASGQTVGFSAPSPNSTNEHATLWSVNGGIVTLTDLTPSGTNDSQARGINDAGQIVGWVQPIPSPQADSYPHATRWTVSGSSINATDLGTLEGDSNGDQSIALAINAAGQIAGSSYAANNETDHAALWSVNGSAITITDLDDPTKSPYNTGSAANAINNAGQIVGSLIPDPPSYSHAMFFTVNQSTITRTDLGTLGGQSSAAAVINAAGEIVGSYGTQQPNEGAIITHAAIFRLPGSGAEPFDLGTLSGPNSSATAVNASGQVIGNSDLTGGAASHGFLYTLASGMQDLNNLVGTNPVATNLTVGSAVNDWGQIPGVGTVSGQSHAVLLDPTSPLNTVLGAAQDTKLIGGMNYRQTPAFTNPASGSYATTLTLLDGVAGSGGTDVYGLNRDLAETFAANNGAPLASDAAMAAGTAADTFVLQFSVDPATAQALFGDVSDSRLGWLDGGNWVNAVNGNTGGTANFVGNRPYNPATDFQLGNYGVDTTNHVVWAVVNHDGLFGVTAANPPPSATIPQITSATAAAVPVNTSFAYQTTATNSPASFAANGLPAGLSIDPASGVISGAPSQAGAFTVRLFATNPSGTGTATLMLTVGGPAVTSTTITSLPCSLVANGQYTLAGNLVSSQTSGNLITVAASNVTIDLQGHYIAGPVGNASQSTVGIYAYERSNVTIQNGTIAYCQSGVEVLGNGTATTNNVDQIIDNLRVTYCYGAGIVLAGAPSSRVTNCQISAIGSHTAATAAGVQVTGAGVTVQGCAVSNLTVASGGTSYGLELDAGSFARANALSNATYGISAGLYQSNEAHACTTAFTGGTDAGGNAHD